MNRKYPCPSCLKFTLYVRTSTLLWPNPEIRRIYVKCTHCGSSFKFMSDLVEVRSFEHLFNLLKDSHLPQEDIARMLSRPKFRRVLFGLLMNDLEDSRVLQTSDQGECN